MQNTTLNKAIEEAIEFGFTKQLVLVNGMIKKLLTGKLFLKEDFAVVKTYSVNAKNYKGSISYIVLSDGTLGYLIKETKQQLRRKINKTVEKYARFEK